MIDPADEHPILAGALEVEQELPKPFDIRWRRIDDAGFLRLFRSSSHAIEALRMIAPDETAVAPMHDWTPEAVIRFLEHRDWIATAIQPPGALRELPNWSWSFSEWDTGMTFQFTSCGPPLHVLLERIALIAETSAGIHLNANHP